MVIYLLEIVDITMFLHYSKESNNDFRCGMDENLTLATLFGVEYGFQGIGQYTHPYHFTLLQPLNLKLGNSSTLNVERLVLFLVFFLILGVLRASFFAIIFGGLRRVF
jgi:hypothetical protein